MLLAVRRLLREFRRVLDDTAAVNVWVAGFVVGWASVEPRYVFIGFAVGGLVAVAIVAVQSRRGG